MKDEKKLKRDIRTIWESLKHERRERSKMFGAADLAESAQRIAGYAADLRDLAKRAEALHSSATAAPEKPAPQPKAKQKAKTAADADQAAQRSDDDPSEE